MSKIIHLSDLHIGYSHCLGHFNQVVTNLIFLKQPAADYTIVITGDLVDDATQVGLYALARTEIARLRNAGYRVLVCPGNHDYGTGSFGHKDYVSQFNTTFQSPPTITTPTLDIIGSTAFIGLDSMAEELNWYDRLFAEGELGATQLTALGTTLATPAVQACQYRVVYLHHHPFEPRPFHGLKDSAALGPIVAGKIDALLYGHNHDAHISNGVWDIPRCYDAGSSTRKTPGKASPHRVIDLSRDARFDYDANFHP